MRAVGILSALYCLLVLLVVGGGYFLGVSGESSQSFPSKPTNYKVAKHHYDAATGYPLAPVLAVDSHSGLERSWRQVKRYNKQFKRNKKKYGKTDKKTVDVERRLAQATNRTDANAGLAIHQTKRRSMTLLLAFFIGLIGSVVVALKKGLPGGIVMILGALWAIIGSLVTTLFGALLLVFGIVALVLGIKARGAAKKKSGKPSTSSTSTSRAPVVMTGTPPTVLRPRSISEKSDYLGFQRCTCGAQQYQISRGGVFFGADNSMTSKDNGTCRQCGATRTFEFHLPDDPLPPGGPGVPFEGRAPSTLLDPGQYLELSDRYAKARAGSMGNTDTLKAAIVYLEEVLKFIPDGMDEVPGSAFWSEESRHTLKTLPGQFSKGRLEAKLGAYVKLHPTYKPTPLPSAPPARPPAGSGGPARPPRPVEVLGARDGGVRGQPPLVLEPRTISEKHDYIALRPCSTCQRGGLRVNRGGLFQGNDGEWCTRDMATCPHCSGTEELTFQLNEMPLPGGGADQRFEGRAPSTLLDAGQFLDLSDVYARRCPADISGLAPREQEQARHAMRAAIVYLEEALKFIPDGVDEVPANALFSDASRRIHAAMPGQFMKFRLEARMGAYRGILKKIDPSSPLTEPPGASPAPQASAPTPAPPKRAGHGYNIVLLDVGPKKISVIKLIRESSRLGLKEAKELSERPNAVLGRFTDESEAWAEAARYQEVGARVNVKPA